MWGSLLVYSGLVLGLAGLVLVVKPVARLGVGTRRRALVLAAVGVLLTVAGFGLPAPEHLILRPTTQLDRFLPAWHFREVHSLEVAVAPERVYEAMRRVRADEISLYRALTWIRRGGRGAPPSVLNPGSAEPLIDVATRTGFVLLADSAPREFVMGTVVLAPAGVQGELTAEFFRRELSPGYAVAAMNFLVRGDGRAGSVLITETRVFATSPGAKRRFAVYWRVIYPGSSLIRRMWLRAIRRRAERAGGSPGGGVGSGQPGS